MLRIVTCPLSEVKGSAWGSLAVPKGHTVGTLSFRAVVFTAHQNSELAERRASPSREVASKWCPAGMDLGAPVGGGPVAALAAGSSHTGCDREGRPAYAVPGTIRLRTGTPLPATARRHARTAFADHTPAPAPVAHTLPWLRSPRASHRRPGSRTEVQTSGTSSIYWIEAR